MKVSICIIVITIFTGFLYSSLSNSASRDNTHKPTNNKENIMWFEQFRTSKEALNKLNEMFPAGTDVEKLQLFLSTSGAHRTFSAEEKDPFYSLKAESERELLPMRYWYAEEPRNQNRIWNIDITYKDKKVINIEGYRDDERSEAIRKDRLLQKQLLEKNKDTNGKN